MTPRQRTVLECIKTFQEKMGYTPSIREIGAYLGLSSSATIKFHLDNLEKHGYIKRINPRYIKIIKENEDDTN